MYVFVHTLGKGKGEGGNKVHNAFLINFYKKLRKMSQALVARACNPRYSRGRGQEDLRLALASNS
jgi:hypothetical protein